MVDNPPNRRILSQVAWPLETLYDEYGYFCGFVMSKLEGTVTLQVLYEYPQVKYPDMRLRNKVVVAQNICAVLSDLHEAGYIFGDFNPANIGVNPKNGEVAFFDMDTCHFRDRWTGHTYRCMGGCDGYVAPELLEKVRRENKSFGEASLPTFTENTDDYSLAIHIFKLLMNGISPYADGYRFDQVMVHPPALPHKEALSAELHGMFSRACNNKGLKRPNAAQWHEALLRFEKNLTNCLKNPVHDYRASCIQCPYCEADRRHQDILKRCGFSGNQGITRSRVTQQSIPPTTYRTNSVTQGNSYPPGNIYPSGGKGGRCFLIGLLTVFLIGCILTMVYCANEIREYKEAKAKQSVESVYVTQPEVVTMTENREPLPVVISEDTFSGNINSDDETDVFIYTAPYAGVYYFDCKISDSDNGYYVYLQTEGHEKVASEFYRDGVTVELEAGTRYHIEVRAGTVQKPFFYQVKIGVPQPVSTIYGNQISGSFKHRNQENWYIFTPEETGDYIFTPQIDNSEEKFLYMIFGADKCCMESGNHTEELYEELFAGETYYIKVMQFQGYPSYDISISKKTAE